MAGCRCTKRERRKLWLHPCHASPQGETRPRARGEAITVLKAEIPDVLKADLPQSKWGKILSGTPVVLAVVATMLAGLASSEMTRAQYDRSLAAQLQSKAGDQWSFFQAKRLRSALQNNTLDLLLTSASVARPSRNWASALQGTSAGTALEGPAGQVVLGALRDGTLPKPAAAGQPDPHVRTALTMLETAQPEPQIMQHLANVDDSALEDAVRAARDQTTALDVALKPINQAIETIEKQLERSETEPTVRRDFVAARLGYNARRYDIEARLNQGAREPL
jgi:hypothetical protein